MVRINISPRAELPSENEASWPVLLRSDDPRGQRMIFESGSALPHSHPDVRFFRHPSARPTEFNLQGQYSGKSIPHGDFYILKFLELF